MKVTSSVNQPISMTWNLHLTRALWMLTCMMSLLHRGAGQACSGSDVTILSSSQALCEGERVDIQCTGSDSVIAIYKDGTSVYDGTSLIPELQSRDVSVSKFSRGDNCLSVFLLFLTTIQADTGNYTCRTNATESSVLRLAVESPVNPHDCSINAATGPVIEIGENVTCSSATGQPSWVNIDSAAAPVNTGSMSVVALAYHSLNSTLLTTLECNVASLPSSTCPSTSTSCIDRIVVVPDPVNSYVSLTPTLETIRVGGSATFSCTSSLNGARLDIASLISSDAISSTIHRRSDTDIQIILSNITMNFTDPIVQCTLQYNGMSVASAFASILVLEVEIIMTTELPTTSQVSTMMITNRTDYMSSTSTPRDNIITTGYVSTTGGFNVTVPIVNGGGFPVFDTRFLIIGLVIGLLIFVAVVVLCALVFRQNARKKGEWTIASTSRRRGQAEVASSGIEGRLEWETDVNPLVVFETSNIDAVTSENDIDDDNGTLTQEDLEDPRVTMSNGCTKHMDQAPPTLKFNAVIENHVAHDTEATPSAVDDVSGFTNEGYSPDHHDIIIHSVDMSEAQDKPIMSTKEISDSRTNVEVNGSIPNGHVAHPKSDIDNEVANDADHEIDISSLNFIDATRLETGESDKDRDSGYSLEHDSVLSEIDDDAITIVSV